MSLMKHMETEAQFERTLKEDAARFGQGFKTVYQHMGWREYTSLLTDAVVASGSRLNSFST